MVASAKNAVRIRYGTMIKIGQPEAEGLVEEKFTVADRESIEAGHVVVVKCCLPLLCGGYIGLLFNTTVFMLVCPTLCR